jgi:hypothetical protein
MLAVSAVVIPSVAWLVNEVLALRVKIVEIETRMGDRDRTCDRHQIWNAEIQRSVHRMDLNIARLCQKAGVSEAHDLHD